MARDPFNDEGMQRPRKRPRDPGSASRGWNILRNVIGAALLSAGAVVLAGRPIAFAVVDRQITKRFPELRWLDGPALASWRADGSRRQPVILDARTETEYSVSHLAGAVRIDPYRPLLRPLEGVPVDTPIVVYASVGYRSARVAAWLQAQGYTDVQNLEGGIFRWANEEQPIFSQDAPATQVHPYQERWGLLLESSHRLAALPLEKRSAAP